MKLNAIVAVTENWGIGLNGGLLRSLKDDMRFFRQTTAGKTVIMGRKTLESFPGGRPLKNRVNLVLTRDREFKLDGAEGMHSVEETIERVKTLPSDDVFVIGGARIYREFLPYCKYAYVTKMDLLMEADSFFPNLDQEPNWILDQFGEPMECDGVSFCFCRYVNNAVKEI